MTKRKVEEVVDDDELVPIAELKKKRNKRKKDEENDRSYLDPGSVGTSYYYEGYLRKVYPYYYQYRTWCKGRWMGRKLMEVLSTEFRNLPPEPLEYKIKTGSILVNNNPVGVDYVLKGHDFMTHRAHRHELPILASDIEIVHEDENMLVVNKPPSIPTHCCGRYRFNTMIAILYTEHGYKDLQTCHRLDRLTSGILMFGKNVDATCKIHKEIGDRTVKKEYLCRVIGNFPDEEVTVDQPLDVLCRKIGAAFISSTGKESQTTFKKISFNGKSSLVHCFPKTGRTHQIRVHLQYLGFPIVNDPLYDSFAFGPEKGKNGNYGMDQEQLMASVRKEHMADNWFEQRPHQDVDSDSKAKHNVNTKTYLGKGFAEREPKFDPSKMTKDPVCEECDHRYKEQEANHMMMFLHSLKYSGSDWSYETKPPFWAEDGYDLV